MRFDLGAIRIYGGFLEMIWKQLSQTVVVTTGGSQWASHPMNRVGDPAEVVNAVLFLASDDSAFTTGDSISVDGGVIAI